MKLSTSSNTNNSKSLMIELFRFSLPLILSGILQQLYSWIDAFIVGNVEGELALGAIGGTGTIIGFYQFAIIGFTIGLAVLAGQRYGAKDDEMVREILSTFSVVLTGVFFILAIVGHAFVFPVLRLINTPSDTILLAGTYLKIVFVGLPFLAVYNTYSAVLRSIGDSKAPFYAILVSSVMNVVMDIILVAVFHYGIAGAAWATTISQIAMTVFLVIYALKKHTMLRFPLNHHLVHRRAFMQGIRFGIPPMIQNLVASGGNLLLQNFMNSFGTATVVAITSSYRVDTLAMLPIVNLGSAISTFTAQSYGARDYERTIQTRKAGLTVMLLASIVLTVLVIPFGSRFVALFGVGEEATQISHRFFVRLASFYVIFGMYNALRGYLEGTGDVVLSSVISILSLLTRVICSYTLPHSMGNMIIAYAEGISWVLALTLYTTRVIAKRESLRRQMTTPEY